MKNLKNQEFHESLRILWCLMRDCQITQSQKKFLDEWVEVNENVNFGDLEKAFKAMINDYIQEMYLNEALL